MSRMALRRPTLAEIRKGGFSTPWDAPMIPRFPFCFRNARILTVFYRTDPDAVALLIPPPLEPAGDTVAIHIYDMPDTDWLGPYGECNVMVPARLGDGPVAGYSPYLFLGSDVGVAHGREIHGQPKKLADVTLENRGDLVVGTVARNRIEVITATTPYRQHEADPAGMRHFFDFSQNYNLKAVDHIDGRPAIRQITARRLSELVVHECWSGPGTVELRANAQAPVFRLPVREMLVAYDWRASFTLVPGEVLFDYLEGET